MKKYKSDQAVLWSKWSPYEYTILAKEQFGHSYTLWTMAIMIFSPVSNSSNHPLLSVLGRIVKNLKMSSEVVKLGIGIQMRLLKESGFIVKKPHQHSEKC